MNNKIFLKNQWLKFGFVPIALGIIITIMTLIYSGIAIPFLLPEESSIQAIKRRQSSLQKSRGYRVILTGKVIKTAPFLQEQGAYQLVDENGATIWVYTKQTLPSTGQIISLEGKVKYQSIAVDAKEIGDVYVLEIKRLPDKSQE